MVLRRTVVFKILDEHLTSFGNGSKKFHLRLPYVTSVYSSCSLRSLNIGHKFL